MSKFKVGDKVVINKVMVGSEHDGCYFTETMRDYIGEEAVIVICERNLYYAKHSDGRFCGYAESWIRHAEDDFPVYKDGKIDINKLQDILICEGNYLSIYQDGSIAIRSYVDNEVFNDIGFNYDELNTLYKEITSQKKQSLMDQIVKDSIEQEIKKMEDAIAELRKQIN